MRAYQLIISPWLPPTCKFYPSCSSYMVEAIQHHGFFSGVWLGIRRLARCHPWNDGGYDPVPGTPRLIPVRPEEPCCKSDCHHGSNGL